MDKSVLWPIPGLASLALFASILTGADNALPGRAHAAYGGVYIASAMLWMWSVEGHFSDRWDAAGLAL